MRNPRRGSNAIEFAMLAPLYTAFMMGIFDYSWLVYQTTSVTAAVQESCRSAAMADPGLNDANMNAIYNDANTKMKAALVSNGLTCTTGCVRTTMAVGPYPNRALRCDMRTPYQGLTGFVPAPKNLSSRAVVRLEYQRR